jgi:hypothetical protein
MLQIRTLFAVAVLPVVTSIVIQGSPASATPPATGCPSGFALVAVGDLAPLGYRVPGIVDDPANTYGFGHQHGNGDGSVCARLLGEIEQATGQPLYEFFDNTLPAS